MKAKQLLFVAVVVAILVTAVAIPVAAEDEIPMWVSSIHLACKGRSPSSARVVGTVFARDANQDAVEGAQVTVYFYGPENVLLASAVTSAQGSASFQLRARDSGTYKLCVDNVSKDGWDYVPELNKETCDLLIVP